MGSFDFCALVLDSVLGREVTSLSGDGGGWGRRGKTQDGGRGARQNSGWEMEQPL